MSDEIKVTVSANASKRKSFKITSAPQLRRRRNKQ
jgi:hypothetical protein